MGSAFVLKGGQERNVMRNYVTQDAKTMVSAGMAHASAFRVGMESTVHWVSNYHAVKNTINEQYIRNFDNFDIFPYLKKSIR